MLENCISSNLSVFNSINDENMNLINKEENNFSEVEIKRRLLNLNLIEEKRRKRKLEMEEKNKLEQMKQSKKKSTFQKNNNYKSHIITKYKIKMNKIIILQKIIF